MVTFSPTTANSLICVCTFLHVLDAKLFQPYFYSAEWTSRIPAKELVSGDTLQIRHVSIHANNERNTISPTITGINRNAYVLDGYSNWTYPIQRSFSIKWDFHAQLTPIGMIRVVTNCGHREPSSFCANSTFRFNTSNGRQVVQQVPLTANTVNIVLFTYNNDCDNNTLLYDAALSETCNWKCSECFNFLYVDLHSMVMNTSSTSPLGVSTSTDPECICPAFKLEKTTDGDVLQIWDMNDDQVGAITSDLSDDSRVQIQWNRWLGVDRRCRQYFLPNVDDFMNVPAYKGIGIHFNFLHTDGALFHYELENNTDLYESFQFELTGYFNALFNLSWVAKVEIYELSDQSLPEQGIYAYEIWVPSWDQLSSLSALQLQSLYLNSVVEMYAGIEVQLADSFGANLTFIEGLNSSHYIEYAQDDLCDDYFMVESTTSRAPTVSVEPVSATVIAAIVLLTMFCCVMCCATIYCFHKGKLCFEGRKKWTTHDAKPSANLDNTTPEGAEEEGHTTTSAVSSGSATAKMSAAATEPAPQTVSSRPAAKKLDAVSAPPLPFVAGQSIRITNVDDVVKELDIHETPDYAQLRAQSLSKQESQNMAQLKIRKNVSERVIHHPAESASVYEHGPNLGVAGAAKRHFQGKTSYDYGNKSYPAPQPDKPAGGHLAPTDTRTVSYDYGKQSNQSSATTARNSDYYSLPQQSSGSSASPEMDPINEPQEIQLSAFAPLVEPPNHAENKIDDALDKAKRQNKVTEFTDFDKELKLLKLIGKGSFGKVYKAKWDAEFVAVKIFSGLASSGLDSSIQHSLSQTKHSGGSGINGLAKSDLQVTAIDDEQFKELYAEIVLATSMPPHPNIVSINGFCRKPLCVVMEFMAGGSVQKLVYGLTTRPQPNVTEKLVILIKACYGLQHLTTHGLHHRDVAARNILLGEYTKVIDDGTKVKITDFGMTRTDNDSDKSTQKTKSDGGPYKWMAPESIQDQEYNEKTDVFMFGVTMWEIMYGREPYENVDAINAAMQVCMKDERPEFLWDLPSGLTTLIKKCWSKDPEDRPTFKMVAKRLQKIESSMASDIQENREMDAEVEQEREDQAKAEEVYNQLDLSSVEAQSDGAYDVFSQ